MTLTFKNNGTQELTFPKGCSFGIKTAGDFGGGRLTIKKLSGGAPQPFVNGTFSDPCSKSFVNDGDEDRVLAVLEDATSPNLQVTLGPSA